MELIGTIITFVHYLKHTVNLITRPLAYVSAAAIILTTFNANEAKAQSNNFKNTNMEITETGYGNLFIKNENDQGIEGATITWTPVDIPGDSIPEPYTFPSNNEGISSYEVLVFHDTGVGMQDLHNIEVVQARPNPSTDFTLNFISNQRPDSPLRIISRDGKMVGEYNITDYNNNVAVYHVDLSDKSNGVYIASTIIDGKPYSSKLVKINGSYSGNLGSSAKSVSSNFKNVEAHEAIYDITIAAEGYLTLTDQRIVTEGDQGTDFYTLISDEEPPIDNLDLEGYIWKLENTNSTLENAQVIVTVDSNGDEYTANSDANGHFIVEDLPLGEDITFNVGGISGRYSFTGINFTTPSEITNPADSVNDNFSAVLPLKRTTTTAEHIILQTKNGTGQQIIYFYLGNTFDQTQKNTIRNYFITLEADEGGVYDFEESSTPLENTGINIEFGTYNTNPTEATINTPLGQTLYPILYANTTMGTSSGYSGFVHEIKRAIGIDEVGWYSVMRADAPDYTLEDKEIAQFFERPYWNAFYQENKTWIDLNKIAEDLNSKSSNTSVKDVNGRVDELNEIAN